MIIYAGTSGMLDDLPVEQVKAFEAELYRYARYRRIPPCCRTIREKKALDDALKGQLNTVLKEFKERFVSQHNATAAAKA